MMGEILGGEGGRGVEEGECEQFIQLIKQLLFGNVVRCENYH
jgi:hypothetical protein